VFVFVAGHDYGVVVDDVAFIVGEDDFTACIAHFWDGNK
jgi:hypothetical protein